MDENGPRIDFPATCPICAKRVVMNFRPEDLRAQLANSQPIECGPLAMISVGPQLTLGGRELRIILGGDARLVDTSDHIEDDNSDPPFGSLGSIDRSKTWRSIGTTLASTASTTFAASSPAPTMFYPRPGQRSALGPTSSGQSCGLPESICCSNSFKAGRRGRGREHRRCQSE